MAYQVEFLDPEVFEALPYPDMDRALGVADPRTQRAYVRKTGVRAVDLFNAAHELEHLQDGHDGAHADHYRNGVYYKMDFGSMLGAAAPIFSAIPGIGPLLSGAAGIGGGLLHGQAQNQQAKQAEGQQQQAMGNVMNQFQAADQGNTPNVVQAQGAAGGSQSGPSGPGGLNQIQQSLYGNYSGR